MSEKAIREIDAVLKKTSQLYFAYTLGTTPLVWGLMTVLNVRRKLVWTVPLSLLISGSAAWVHVLKTYDKPSLIYLKIGLDPEYPSIRAKKSKR